METPCKLRSSVLYSHARRISRARRRVAMVARAAPREQEELLKDALSRTVKTLRVRKETVERLALRGNREPKIGGKRKKNKINTNDDFGDSAALEVPISNTSPHKASTRESPPGSRHPITSAASVRGAGSVLSGILLSSGSGSPSRAPSISRSRTEQKSRCQQEEDAWVPSWW
ncbi:hypothetical protein NDU88_000804 [Pleurodeles waltl]|uniref:Uncharacterized protein n=1 Tax=Pleurodeles waltl TaxID=8319 RepID=A0AAV7L9G5_PLEWA|nr:hypothetical protein NDU88_000804 [Pleurodeles waltl]